MLDITLFCNPTDPRSYISAPFNFKQFTIATNGHAIIFSPITTGHPEPDNLGKRSESIEKIIAAHSKAIYQPMPNNLEWPEKTACPTCNGKGKADIKDCPECEGSGEIDFENDFNCYRCDCKSCDGKGETIETETQSVCKHCHGSGLVYSYNSSVKILDTYINPDYLQHIVNQPDIQIATTDSLSSDSKFSYREKPLLFASGEQFGMIMPMRKPHD